MSASASFPTLFLTDYIARPHLPHIIAISLSQTFLWTPRIVFPMPYSYTIYPISMAHR